MHAQADGEEVIPTQAGFSDPKPSTLKQLHAYCTGPYLEFYSENRRGGAEIIRSSLVTAREIGNMTSTLLRLRFRAQAPK